MSVKTYRRWICEQKFAREVVVGSFGRVRRTQLLGGLLNHYPRKTA